MMLLDELNGLVHAPEKLVSQKFALSVIPRDGFLDILLGFEGEANIRR